MPGGLAVRPVRISGHGPIEFSVFVDRQGVPKAILPPDDSDLLLLPLRLPDGTGK